MQSYSILPYNDENLAIALSLKISKERIKERSNYLYLKNYLGENDGIKAKTIIIETNYVSKSYFTDYSNYYSTCFNDYDRFCNRLHFFKVEINEKTLIKEILSDSDFLDKNYLGYVVVKPLNNSVIGPTLLTTYEENDLRSYPAVKSYSVNFFGKNLTIKSLAYQEQDTVVSACASVAIWSAFHKTSQLFKTILPSPGEITKLAGNLFFNYGRLYPNSGLDLTQVCRAIDQVGLVSEVRSSKKFEGEIYLASRIIYAYLRCGIPILLLIKYSTDQSVSVGHAVTVVGYSNPKKSNKKPKQEIALTADGIDRFYVHDDQLGPFASYEFSGITALKTYHWNQEKSKEYQPSWIHAIVIPVYQKIRIGFEDVFEKVECFDSIFFTLGLFNFEIVWDIYLQESNNYKSDILNTNLDEKTKIGVVTKSFPKYIWVARALISDHSFLDLIFDSTDVPNGKICIDLIVHEVKLATPLSEVLLKYPKIFTEFENGPNLDYEVYNSILSKLEFLKEK